MRRSKHSKRAKYGEHLSLAEQLDATCRKSLVDDRQLVHLDDFMSFVDGLPGA